MNRIRDACIRYSQGKLDLRELHTILNYVIENGVSKTDQLLIDKINPLTVEYTDGDQVDSKLKYAIKRAVRK